MLKDILENVSTVKEAIAEMRKTVDICTELPNQHDNVRNVTRDQFLHITVNCVTRAIEANAPLRKHMTRISTNLKSLVNASMFIFKVGPPISFRRARCFRGDYSGSKKLVAHQNCCCRGMWEELVFALYSSERFKYIYI